MAKDLFIVRGLPGAGKTTIANLITKNVFSADDYFVRNGIYHFDMSKISNAHAWCRGKVKEAMKSGKTKIAVANTFTEPWEWEAIESAAKEYGYRVHHIVVENRHGSKSTHNVPDPTIKKMRQRFSLATG
jgi:predicted kinase